MVCFLFFIGMNDIDKILLKIDNIIWGPGMLVFLIGTGIYMTIIVRFKIWRMLFPSIKHSFGNNARKSQNISSFAALTTTLGATIGTGNIVGVGTALALGGPGALVWMWISALFGMTTKFSECMLAVKYREVSENGDFTGGPMYTLKNGLGKKTGCDKIGKLLGGSFAISTIIASFGIGNMTQSSSIAYVLKGSFDIPVFITGLVIATLTMTIILGGIKNISRVSAYIVPLMTLIYIISGLMVIACNISYLPRGIKMIFAGAFSVKSVTGGICGGVTVSVFDSMRYGVSRGCFSNEAGMGSGAITAAAADSEDYVLQGYINMTAVFWDTIVLCTITGLMIVCSGVYESSCLTNDGTGQVISGVGLAILAYEKVFGKAGGLFVGISIILFAFTTIIGWEYQGEMALGYIIRNKNGIFLYRKAFVISVFIGAVMTVNAVWRFSDIANGLMIIPNLISIIVLKDVVAEAVKEKQD